jgi:membrane protein implicated in regulation of membrane protease activity
MGAGAAVFAMSWYLDKMWMAVPIFLGLAVAAIYVWIRVLRSADDMANQRRDSMIAALMKE